MSKKLFFNSNQYWICRRKTPQGHTVEVHDLATHEIVERFPFASLTDAEDFAEQCANNPELFIMLR